MKLVNNKGLTLVELVISIAILGIIAISLFTLFTTGTAAIFSMGEKTQTAAEAQAIIDRIYEKTTENDLGLLENEINGILDEMIGNGNYTSEVGDFNAPYDDAPRVRYYLQQEILLSNQTVPKITMRIYYRNGDRNVTITTPLVR